MTFSHLFVCATQGSKSFLNSNGVSGTIFVHILLLSHSMIIILGLYHKKSHGNRVSRKNRDFEPQSCSVGFKQYAMGVNIVDQKIIWMNWSSWQLGCDAYIDRVTTCNNQRPSKIVWWFRVQNVFCAREAKVWSCPKASISRYFSHKWLR